MKHFCSILHIFVIVIYRYSGQKKYTEALNLIYNGAVTLLQHNQVRIVEV